MVTPHKLVRNGLLVAAITIATLLVCAKAHADNAQPSVFAAVNSTWLQGVGADFPVDLEVGGTGKASLSDHWSAVGGLFFGTTAGSNEARTSAQLDNFEADRSWNNFDVRHSFNLSALYALPFEPYAPIRRQLGVLLRYINRTRKAAGLAPVPKECLRFYRNIYCPFTSAAPSARAQMLRQGWQPKPNAPSSRTDKE